MRNNPFICFICFELVLKPRLRSTGMHGKQHGAPHARTLVALVVLLILHL